MSGTAGTGLAPAARTQSIYGAMRRAPGAPSRGRRARWLVSLVAMWVFLAYPIADVVRRHLSVFSTAAVLALLAVFAVLWLRTMWLALATTAPTADVVRWLAAAALVGLPTAIGLGGQGFIALLIYLSIAGAVSLPLRTAFPAIVGCTVAAAPVLWRSPGSFTGAVVLNQLSYVFWLGVMMLFYRRMMLLVIELRQAREELASMAVTAERLRIARDLHDLLGHSLSTISLKAQLARRLAAGDPVVAAEIADIEAVAGGALTEVREAVTGYRNTGLTVELDAARRALAAAGVACDLDLEALDTPRAVDALLGWALREAVTNVVRHSRARHCTILLRRRADTVVLRVTDDGTAVPGRSTSGNGLTGLAERVGAGGGVLDAAPLPAGAPGHGYRLVVTLPLPQRSRPDGRPQARAVAPAPAPARAAADTEPSGRAS